MSTTESPLADTLPPEAEPTAEHPRLCGTFAEGEPQLTSEERLLAALGEADSLRQELAGRNAFVAGLLPAAERAIEVTDQLRRVARDAGAAAEARAAEARAATLRAEEAEAELAEERARHAVTQAQISELRAADAGKTRFCVLCEATAKERDAALRARDMAQEAYVEQHEEAARMRRERDARREGAGVSPLEVAAKEATELLRPIFSGK